MRSHAIRPCRVHDFVSSIFDNIPLTALALKQGGYDWGILAYAVGFGGSMIWFGSSAGVALSNLFPEARSVGQWVRHGWHVAVAYVVVASELVTIAWASLAFGTMTSGLASARIVVVRQLKSATVPSTPSDSLT